MNKEMKKLNYYTAIEEMIDESGKKWCIPVSGTREQDFKRSFKTIEEVKIAINHIYKARQRKDITRTYADGTTKRLSQTDIYDFRYIIRKHYEEIEEIETNEHPKTSNIDKDVIGEETSIY